MPHARLFHLRKVLAATLPLCFVATVLVLPISSVARAALIDVQFVSPGGSGANGTTGTAFSGAALTGAAGDEWNQLSAASGSSALLASDGSSSGISLSYSATVAYGLASYQQQFLSTPYANLMQSFLVSHNGEAPMTLAFQGLTPGEAFSLYLYGQSASTSYGETVTVNGAVQTALQTNASTFIANDNYVLFQGVADSSGMISISDVTPAGLGEADLNGMQLLTASIPEPGTIALFGFGLVGLTTMRPKPRRRRG